MRDRTVHVRREDADLRIGDGLEVERVEVTPATVSMEEGETRTVVAVARDARGREFPDRTITWTTSDATIAEVDAAGRISAKRVGQLPSRASGSAVDTRVVA